MRDTDGNDTGRKGSHRTVGDLTYQEGRTMTATTGAAPAGSAGAAPPRSFDELRELPRQTRSYHPTMDASAVQQLHGGWQAAVKRVL